MMRSLVLTILIAAGCSTQLKLVDRPCPCSSGWTCCENRNVCVRDGMSCPAPAMVVTPDHASLALEHSLQLQSAAEVTWTVVEAGGGTITPRGLYTAPLRLGTFHVVATSTADSSQRVSVPITVGPVQLDLEAGQPGGAGHADDVGLDARFDSLGGITGDGNGHLFVADGLIRQIDVATAAVTTISAGLPGWSAWDLTYDRGALYVVGYNGQYNVYKLDVASGAATFVAGGGGAQIVDGIGAAAEFSRISGIVADGQGHLYVLDTSESSTDGAGRIRRIDLESGSVTTVAGAAASYGTPPKDGVGPAAVLGQASGVAFDGAMVSFLDPDPSGKTAALRTFDPVSGAVKTTSFSSPVTESYSPFAGSLCGSGYVAAGASVWPALPSLPGYSLHKALVGENQVGDQDSPAPFFSDRLRLFCEGSTIYVADAGNHKLRTIDLAQNDAVATLAGQSGHDATALQQPIGLPIDLVAVAADGSLLLSNSYNLERLELTHGTRTTLLNDTQLDYGTMQGLTVDADGTVYVTVETAGAGQAFVATVDLSTGTLTSVAGGAGGMSQDGIGAEARFGSPTAVVTDGKGHLYVADASAGSVRKVDLATRTVTTIASNLAGPKYLAYGLDTLFVTETLAGPRWSDGTYRGGLVRINLGSGQSSSVVGDGRFASYGALAFDPAGVLYVSDRYRSVVRAVDLSNGATIDVIGQQGRRGVKTGAIPGGLNAPGAVVISGEDLFISDKIEAVILRARLAR